MKKTYITPTVEEIHLEKALMDTQLRQYNYIAHKNWEIVKQTSCCLAAIAASGTMKTSIKKYH